MADADSELSLSVAELTAVESQLQEIDSAFLQKSKQIAKLLDAIETGEGEGDLSLIRRRLRDREAEIEDLRARRGEVQDKRDGIRREVLEDGFFQQDILRATLPDGTPFVLSACMVVKIENGLIVRVDEYLDSAELAPLRDFRP